MSVAMLADERDEQRAIVHEPRVGLRTADLHVAVTHEVAADRAGHRRESARLHRASDRAAIASRATTRSSNGTTAPSDLLVGLVSLAGDHDDVAVASLVHGEPDRGPAIGLDRSRTRPATSRPRSRR